MTELNDLPIPLDRICDCPVYPRMTWIKGGRIVEQYALDFTRDGEADGDRFIASGADLFEVDCPACGWVYLRGRPPQ